MFKKIKISSLQLSLLILSLTAVLFAGCGSKFVAFGGKVTASDGQPYTKGYVIFSNGQYSAQGKLQSNGTYVLDSLGNGDGLTPGTYRVYLSAFQENIGTENEPIYVSDIDLKYEDPDTSGLSCGVIKGGRFDFVVELK
ncbi:MAG: hypothetical protein LBJ00_13015 [Planctomycetaceae bacterium]|jgi:hypothetical protein|nr:hypothetical protein [Planctomycetaceae bacterium]